MLSNSPLLLLYESLCESEKYVPASRDAHEGAAADAEAPRVLLFPLACPNGDLSEPMYAVVVHTQQLVCVYRGTPKLTYGIALNEVSETQRENWQRDLRAHCLAPEPVALQRYGARRGAEVECCEVLREALAMH